MMLAVSNIAWEAQQDETMYKWLQAAGIRGLEIAPTRLFQDRPYDHCREASELAELLKKRYGLQICSMQSIWYGKNERIDESEKARQELLDYTEKAIRFANAAGCRNLVFGCPRNRMVSGETSRKLTEDFLLEIAELARAHDVVIALEANPKIYHTNFMNTTAEVVDFVRAANHPGLTVNLDVGAMLCNQEQIGIAEPAADKISHVHVSEPMLRPVVQRPLHSELAAMLKGSHYGRAVSLEMGKNTVETVQSTLEYLKTVFE